MGSIYVYIYIYIYINPKPLTHTSHKLPHTPFWEVCLSALRENAFSKNTPPPTILSFCFVKIGYLFDRDGNPLSFRYDAIMPTHTYSRTAKRAGASDRRPTFVFFGIACVALSQ